jgi:hypothetical protein
VLGRSQREATGMTDERVWTEELRVKGDALVGKIRELVREGNVRRIIIKDSEGRSMIEVPLTLGVVGALVAPVWAAIGAIAALAADWSIVVERREASTGKSGAKRSGGPSGGKAR